MVLPVGRGGVVKPRVLEGPVKVWNRPAPKGKRAEEDDEDVAEALTQRNGEEMPPEGWLEVYCTGTCGGFPEAPFGVGGFRILKEGKELMKEAFVIFRPVKVEEVEREAVNKALEWIWVGKMGTHLRVFLPEGVDKEKVRKEWGGRYFLILEHGRDPELERKVGERWEAVERMGHMMMDIRDIRRQVIHLDVSEHRVEVESLAKETIKFLTDRTPFPGVGLAVVKVLSEAMSASGFGLSGKKRSREALKEIIERIKRGIEGEELISPDVAERKEKEEAVAKRDPGYIY